MKNPYISEPKLFGDVPVGDHLIIYNQEGKIPPICCLKISQNEVQSYTEEDATGNPVFNVGTIGAGQKVIHLNQHRPPHVRFYQVPNGAWFTFQGESEPLYKVSNEIVSREFIPKGPKFQEYDIIRVPPEMKFHLVTIYALEDGTVKGGAA